MAVSNKFLKFQQILFNLFKSQDPENGKFDIVFEVEGKKLYAYKIPLLVLSSTFDSMLSDRWNKNKDEPFPISGYSFDDFFQFLSFIYSGQCELTDKNIFVMVDIAEFYQVELFKDYCDEYLSNMFLNFDNVFHILDLANKLSLICLKASVNTFIVKNFVDLGNSDNFLNVKKEIVSEIIPLVKDEVRAEDLFQIVYKFAEKYAKNKHKNCPFLNLHSIIKHKISDFLPHIDFNMMEMSFLNEFVAPRGFIFHTPDELNKILNVVNSKPVYKVTVTNNQGQKLHGNLVPDENAIKSIKSLKNHKSFYDVYGYAYWYTENDIPITSNLLKQRSGVEWYLACLNDGDGDIGVVHRTIINTNCYLLAEMFAAENGFSATWNCKIEIE